MLYFAYGSNLNKRAMLTRCPQARPYLAATLPGHRLQFQGYANVVADPAGTVSGALYRVTPACLKALDAYEDAPRLYMRRDVTVETAEGPMACFTYVMTARSPNAPGAAAAPEAAYYGEIARGYNDWKLDPALLRKARATEPKRRDGAPAARG